MVKTCGEKDRGICSTENTEYANEWIPKEGKTKTEMERSEHYYCGTLLLKVTHVIEQK